MPLAYLSTTGSVLPQLLLALAAVILVGRLLAIVLGRLGQPPVIGEVLAGILLGPSLLGWVSQRLGGNSAPLLSPEVAPHLAIIAQLGVILYMFLVGVEFNVETFRGLARRAAIISASSLIVPFVLGVSLGLAVAEFTQLDP